MRHRVVVRATLQDENGDDVTWEDWISDEFEGDPWGDTKWTRVQDAVENVLVPPQATGVDNEAKEK